MQNNQSSLDVLEMFSQTLYTEQHHQPQVISNYALMMYVPEPYGGHVPWDHGGHALTRTIYGGHVIPGRDIAAW